MMASLLLLLASLAMATAQLATSNFDFQPYANNNTGLGGIQQAVVQLPSALTYTLNGASQTAPAGSFIMFGGGYEQTAIIPLNTNAAAGSVQPTIIGPPLANYSAIGCGTRSGTTVLYIVGTAANAQTQQTGDIFYVYRSYDGVTWPNVLDAATTQAWMSRQNEDNTMCVVLSNGNVVSIGSNDTWSSANQGVTWTQTAQTGSRWSPRTFFAGGIYTTSGGTDTIVIVGGRDAPSVASIYGGLDHNDVWQSQDAGASWTQLTGAAGFTPRDQLSFAVSQTGLMVVFGGDQYGGYGSFYSDMWYSTNGGSQWSMLKAVTSIGNASQCELLFDSQGYLYLFGLQTNNYFWQPTSARTTVPISTTSGAGQMASVPVVFLLVNVIAVLSYMLL